MLEERSISDTPDTAGTAVLLASLLRTALAAGIHPLLYFRDLLMRIPTCSGVTRLTPHGWKEHFMQGVEAGTGNQLDLPLAALANGDELIVRIRLGSPTPGPLAGGGLLRDLRDDLGAPAVALGHGSRTLADAALAVRDPRHGLVRLATAERNN